MNDTVFRAVRLQELHAYIQACRDRGFAVKDIPDSELESLTEQELLGLIKEVRKLANTPPPRD